MKLEDIPVASLSAVQAGDRARWLALFEEDATVEDPVGGAEPWDPTGEGQRGREAIGRFYDGFAAQQASFAFDIHHLVVCGREVACFLTLTIGSKDGTTFSSKLINIYKVSPAGKIASLRSFWSFG